MMLNKKIEVALNQQMRDEFYSSHLYLAMAAFSDGLFLKGFAHWFRKQAEEERGHAMKLFNYILERDGTPVISEIKKPPQSFSSIVDVMSQTLKHEEGVTASIHKLYELSQKEKDHATGIYLQWFITEQVEEEKSVADILAKIKMISAKEGGLLYLDKALAKRGVE